jgi:hypothetical protein
MTERKTAGAAAAIVVASGITSVHHVYGGLDDGDAHRLLVLRLLVPVVVAVLLTLTFGALTCARSRIALSVFTSWRSRFFPSCLGCCMAATHISIETFFSSVMDRHIFTIR